MTRLRKAMILFGLLLVTLLVLVLAPFFGMEIITPEMLFQPAEKLLKVNIFWKIRLPRVLTAFCAGAALALSGLAFQAMFRNPLATPFTLGVSSGAALGAVFFIKLGIAISFFGVAGQSVSAFLGALFAVLIVYGLTHVKSGFSTATLLLAGVAVNFFCSSFILFVQYLSDFTHSFQIIRWLMGGFEIVGYQPLMTLVPLFFIGSLIIFWLTHELNLLVLGEDIALSRGVNVRKIKTVLFLATSLMVGSVVAVCGPIGFIGMMTPHICRLLLGADHRFLTPATFLFGGSFLVFCDTLARTLIAPAEIPVGVITALLGGPFFLWLLLSSSSEQTLSV